jgi:hypothetical protein
LDWITDVALGVFAVDLDRAIDPLDLATLASGTLPPSGSGQAQGREIGRVLRRLAGPRRSSGTRRPWSMTVPTLRPFEQGRRSFWMSSTLSPKRPAARRSTAILQVLHALVAKREGVFGAGGPS